MNRLVLLTIVGTTIVVGVVGSVVTRPGPHPAPPPATAEAAPPVPQITLTASQLRKKKPTCRAEAPGFDPVTISVAGVISHAPVLTPPRDANGIPGTPPLTNKGKDVFAWDREQAVRPGDARGNVLLNTHTWPRRPALGNKLLAGVDPGTRIVVHGRDGTFLCYRVTREVVVPARQPMWSYYARSGKPQLAIVVCSGPRLGPRNWATRTVWFASPSL